MDENKRYKLFKLFLIFTILNILGIILYENLGKTTLFRTKPEFYVESIKSTRKDGNKDSDRNEKANSGEKVAVKPDNKHVEISEKKILIIGDSNAYLMSQNKQDYEKIYKETVYWLAESGADIDFISKDLKVKLGTFKPEFVENSLTKSNEVDLLKEIKGKGITDIVVLLGVNSLREGFAKELSTRLIKFSEVSKAEVHFVSLLPYVNKSKYDITDNDIINFNTVMKTELSKSGVSYVDAYELVVMSKNYKAETTDGLHYSKKIYDKILDKIMDNIMQNNKK